MEIPGQETGSTRTGNATFLNAPRCGAKNRRGQPCTCPAMRGKRRCRLHGGRSTGARTPEGRERIRQANTNHGFYSAEMLALRREARQVIRQMRDLFRSESLDT